MRNNEDKLLGITKPEDNSSIQQNILSFVVPTEFVDLPSKGKLYPVGHPLRDKLSIEIKNMTAKEEDILTSQSYIKKGVALERLIEAIVIDKNIRPDSIASVDRAAILLAARISAYGFEYKTTSICPSCSKQKNHSYNLSEEPVVEFLKEENGFTETGTIFIELPSTKWKIECKSLFGRDELKNINVKNKSEDNIVSDQLLSIINSIEGVTDRAMLIRAVDVLPAKDSKFLRIKYKELMPSLKFSLILECDCGFNGEVEVPITLEFFWPKS